MATLGSGPLARAFVVVNRIFGVALVLSGFGLLVEFLVALIRGRSISAVWSVGLAAMLCVAIGVIYFRAPLFRTPASAKKSGNASVGGGNGTA
jgi:uncharacterized protein (DUF58 family)